MWRIGEEAQGVSEMIHEDTQRCIELDEKINSRASGIFGHCKRLRLRAQREK